MVSSSELDSLIEKYAKQIEKLSKGTVRIDVYIDEETTEVGSKTIDPNGFKNIPENLQKEILRLLEKIVTLEEKVNKIKKKESITGKISTTTGSVAGGIGSVAKGTTKATGKILDKAYKNKGKLGFIDLSSYYKKPKTLNIVDPRSPIFDKAFQITLYSAIGGLIIVVLVWYAFPLLYNFLLWVTLLGYNISNEILNGADISPPYFDPSMTLRVAYILNEMRDFLYYILPLSLLIGISLVIVKGLKKERIFIEKIGEEKLKKEKRV